MIVGLGYNMGVGKDTAAEALCRELGYRRVGFADKLKQLAMDVNPIVTSDTQTVNLQAGRGRLKWVVQGMGGWDQAKRNYPEVRSFLQDLGHAGREIFGDDFWIEQAIGHLPTDAKIVIPDVRYANEAEAIRGKGGLLINITRPGHTGDSHRSERELDGFDWDVTVENLGTVAELQSEIVRLVRDRISQRVLLPEHELERVETA